MYHWPGTSRTRCCTIYPPMEGRWRIIVNALGKDLELEEGDSVAQTPGESGVEKATCKDEIQSPQPEAGLSKPEAAAIHEEDAQIKQQTSRSDVRVVYVSVGFNFRL